MSVLNALTDAIRDGSVEVIDLTAPLSASTPIIQLPPPFGNTTRFGLTEISHYDERGPAWYWNDIVTGEHTGTHFDAPVHWVTGKDGEDVAQVPAPRLIAPAVVLDFSAEAAANPDFLLEIDHVKGWEAANGPLPVGGWLLTGAFLSNLGLQMLSVAVSWDLYIQTRSALVLGNVGFVQVVPFVVLSLLAGRVWIPPHEKHWHGAGPTTVMVHIAMQEALDGKHVDWLEKVTDEQYKAGGGG